LNTLKSLCLLIATTLSYFHSQAHAIEKLPIEVFARLPDITQLQLSPSGNKALFVKKVEEGDDLFALIYDLKQKKITPVVQSNNQEFKLQWVTWANEDQVLISASFPAVRWGTPTTETRLLVFDPEHKKKKLRNILNKSFYKNLQVYPQFQDDVIDLLPDDPDSILLAVAQEDFIQKNVYKINVKNLKRQLIQRSLTDVRTFITDQQHRVRAAVAFKDTTYTLLVKGTDKKSKWEKLEQFESFSEEQVWPLGFDLDPNILYVRAYHEGRLAIFKTDISKAENQYELVFSDNTYDVNGQLIYSKNTARVIGVNYSKGAGYTFWDEHYLALQRGLEKAFPESFVSVVSFNHDETKAIVKTTSDTDPGTFYFLDRNTGTADYIGSKYKHLPHELMATKQAFKYRARDGLEIEAFITRPKDANNEPLPAIIFPHGGPIGSDDAGFDYWVQFFANRGYAVFQMNFRGSSGYGYDFMKAGLQNWGKAMQDDVEDGVKTLIKQGVIDKNRICIAGASYGGYAALMGAIKTPDLYQCAISFAGVSDVNLLVKDSRKYIHHKVAEEQIGSQSKTLKAVSPVQHAEKINIPVLLIHGTKDRSVPVKHSRKMKNKLDASKKQFRYLELKGGGHYLSNNTNRLTTFKAMDAFLAEHLPVSTN
jgi:dipeptidyl aminopeptidase/acylaminoacyl peptidase